MGFIGKLIGGGAPKRQAQPAQAAQPQPDPKLEAIRKAKERRARAARSTGRSGFRTDLASDAQSGINITR